MIAAEWIAFYGAGLSTVLAIREWRQSRQRLKISSCLALNSQKFQPEGTFTRVTISNKGRRSAFVRSVFLSVHIRPYTILETLGHLYRYWKWRPNLWIAEALPVDSVIEPGLPMEILPGRSLTIWLPAIEFMAISKGRRVRLIVQDELDRSTYGPDLTLHYGV